MLKVRRRHAERVLKPIRTEPDCVTRSPESKQWGKKSLKCQKCIQCVEVGHPMEEGRKGGRGRLGVAGRENGDGAVRRVGLRDSS